MDSAGLRRDLHELSYERAAACDDNVGMNCAYADGHAKWSKIGSLTWFQFTGGPIPSWGSPFDTDFHLHGRTDQ